MRRFKPVHGLFLVLLFVGAILAADYVLENHLRGGVTFERIGPGPDHTVRIGVADLKPLQVRYYRFLNPSNQEVKFLVGRDEGGHIQVGFDASETHATLGRGFRQEGEWMIDNKCGTASRLSEINHGNGGCRPVPLAHRVQGDQVVLAENDILQGWRFFR